MHVLYREATAGYQLRVKVAVVNPAGLAGDDSPAAPGSSPGLIAAFDIAAPYWATFPIDDPPPRYAAVALMDSPRSAALDTPLIASAVAGNATAVFAVCAVADEDAADDAAISMTGSATPLRGPTQEISASPYPAAAVITVFSATDGLHGRELWMTVGTAAGTMLLADINPGPGGSYPGAFTALGNGQVLFAANDGTHGTEPWVTDGTAAGTALLADINQGAIDSGISYLTALGNGQFLFSANDGTHGSELWVTDGTAADTVMVTDIRPESASSNPGLLTALGNGQALFAANDGRHGEELWVTNGTAAGTSGNRDPRPSAAPQPRHNDPRRQLPAAREAALRALQSAGGRGTRGGAGVSKACPGGSTGTSRAPLR